jgi:NAD(P)-dependent dehydrogenase (short-subunit alcohol dehydrogenase family)
MLLAGKRAIVTGASSGIGLATVRVFIKEGAVVCATGRNEDALKKLADETGTSQFVWLTTICDLHCSGCSYVAGDLSHEGEAARVVAESIDTLGGKMSTLINCAGVLRGGAFGTAGCNLENFKYNFAANTQAVFEMMEHCIPHLQTFMHDGGAGASIVNVSSVNAKQSFAGVGNYCASKVLSSRNSPNFNF